MAEDLAVLGFAVDSDPLVDSAHAMDQMAVAATKVDAATRGAVDAQKGLGTSAAAAAAETSRAATAAASLTRTYDVQDAAYRRAMATISAAATAQAVATRSIQSHSAATAELGVANLSAAASIDKAAVSVRRMTQYDDAAAAAYRRATAEISASAAARTSAMRGVESVAASSANQVSANYREMSAAATRYAADVEKTVQRIKVAEAYQSSLRPVPHYSQATPIVPPAPVSPASTPAGLTAQQRLMLSYQANDIFTQLSMGTNPLMVAAQQGPQISQVFGGVGNTIAAIPKPALIAGGAALGAAGILATVNAMKDLSEAADDQKRRLDALLGGQQLAATAYSAITREAVATGIAIEDVSAQFAKFATATTSLGATIPQVMSLTSASGQLGRLGGLTPEETAAGANAMAKALSASVVSADSLQSIFDTMPLAARKIADGLGVSTSQLKLMAQQGDLTSQQVFTSLLGQTEKLKKDFDELPGTIGSVFSSLIIQAEDLAVKLYKSVASLQIMTDRTKEFGGPQGTKSTFSFDNLHAPSGAYPTYQQSLETQLNLNGSDFGAAAAKQLASDWEDAAKAAQRAADASVLAASKIADGLDPVIAEMRSLGQQTDAVAKGLNALQSGIGGFDTSKAAQETRRLTDGLQALREKADAAGGSYLQAIKAVQTRQEQNELGMTPGQRAYAASVNQLAAPGSGVSVEDAQTVVSAQQLQMIDSLIQKQQLELTTQTAVTNAMRSGKAAADDAAVAMQILGITFEQLGNITPELQVRLDVLAETLSLIRGEARKQAAMGASNPLIAELAGINAAMAALTQGAFAMKRAQAEAKAALDGNGGGGLTMKVFDAQQALTDATTLKDLRDQIDLTNKLAAAAGDVAAQRKLELDYTIKKAELNASPGNRSDLRAAMEADYTAKTNRDLAEGTASMEKQLRYTQDQVDLVRSGSVDYQVQLAILTKKRDLLGQGRDIENDAEAQRQMALAGEQARADVALNEARDAADATKRTWMNAYDNIQSAGADTFYDIFSGAEVNGQTVAQSLKNVFLRAFAEIAAAAVIRPIITPIFQAGAAAGIIPAGVVPSATGSLGGVAGGGGAGSVFGAGGSVLNNAGGGWLSRQFSGVSEFLSSPVYGYPSIPGVSNLPAGVMGPAPNTAVGGLGSGGIFSGAGPSWGQAIGGGASIAMGAFNLLRGGQSTAGTIGSVGQMVGGAVTMLPIPGAQIVGPAISILSSIIPGLFGDGGPEIPAMPALAYSGGAFNGSGSGFTTEGTSLGPGSSLASQAETLATSLTTAFKAAGLTVVPGALIGGGLGVGTAHLWDGRQWTDSPYTETELRLPGGVRQGLTFNDTSRNADQASQYLLTQVFKANVLQGGVSGAGAGLKAGLETINPQTTDALNSVIALGTAYDKLGDAINPARDALDKISASFDELKDYATQAGLSLDPINDELKKQSQRSAQDFIDAMLDPLAVQMRALDDAKEQALASAEYIKANIAGVNVDINRIVDYYGKQRLALEDQYYQGGITNLQNLIKSLTYGDLSNASPVTTMAGLRADYEMTLRQARGGDVASIAGFSDIAGQLADYGRQSFASGPEYEALRRQILADVAEVQTVASGGSRASGGSGGNDETAQTNASARLVAQQALQISDLIRDNAETKQALRELTSEMRRRATNRL